MPSQVSRGFLVALFASFLLSPQPARAETDGKRILGIDAMIGFPHLLGVGIQYMGLKWLEVGIGFGSAPVNDVLQKSAGLEPQPLDLGLSDPYTITPLSKFTLTSFSPFVRYFPWEGSVYFELNYSVQRASASVTADLTNDNTGAVTRGVINGSVKFTQVTPALMVGYRPFLSDKLFLNVAGGVAYVQSTGYELGIGGSLSTLAGLTPAGEAEFEQFKADIRSSIDSALRQYRDRVSLLPTLRISLGIAF